jgi:flagellin
MTSINTNLSSLSSIQNLIGLNRSINTNMNRLSSGLRINRASDDAAGLSIANRLNSQMRGLGEAFDAAQTGINLANVADSSLDTVNQNLQRIRELVVQSGNTGVLDQSAQQIIQLEINQYVDEIGRIADTTQFGSNTLLNGDFDSSAGIRPGTPDMGVNVDESDLTTRENFFNITRVQEGAAAIVSGDDPGAATINAGIQNQQDIAVTQGTFDDGTGAAAAGKNLTNVSFNGANLQAGGTIAFSGVLADGVTGFSGSLQISAGSDIAGGGGAGTSLADAIQSSIDAAEMEQGIDSAAGTNAEETNVSFNATSGRMEFTNGAATGVSDFNVDFTALDATDRVQNTTATTRAAEIGGVATGAQVGNAVTAITGNTFDTGTLTIEVSDVTQAQARVVESNVSFQQAGGGAAGATTNLIGSVFNGATLAQGDTISINGTDADGSTFTNTITVSNVDGSAGNGAAVTMQDLVDELNVRDRTNAAGGIGAQSGFEDATAQLTSGGNLQLVDDVAGTSQSNFNITVNDRSAGGGTFATISDSANTVTAGNEQQATVRVNGGPAQRVTTGEETTLYGRPTDSNGAGASQITLRMGDNLSNGSDEVNVTREEFSGSLNGGPDVRFEAGEQDVSFTNGIRQGESVTLDFDANVNVPNAGEGESSTVVISAVSREANFQIGANAGDQLSMRFGDVRTGSLGLGEGRSLNDIDVTEEGGVDEALAIIDGAMEQVNQTRGEIGAVTNRLEGTANSLSVASENLLASRSRIMDADFARESTQNALNQMLLQSNINVLSQANNLYNNMFLDLLR